MKKAYFQYYETFENIVKKFDDPIEREAFREKIINYGLFGIEPKINGALEDMAWEIIKDIIDQQVHRREVNRANRIGKTQTKTEQPKEKPAPRMEKPTLEEIKAFCKEKGYNINAEGFFNYYESNGWKIGGKTLMKNWRAAVQSWAARDRARSGNGMWANGSTDTKTEKYESIL